MEFDEETVLLRNRVEDLENGPATFDDWQKVDAAIVRVVVAAQSALLGLQRQAIRLARMPSLEPEWHAKQLEADHLAGLLDDLRALRLRAQSRIFELKAIATQRLFSRAD